MLVSCLEYLLQHLLRYLPVPVLVRFESRLLLLNRPHPGRESPRLGALELVYVVRDDVIRPPRGVRFDIDAPCWRPSPASIWRGSSVASGLTLFLFLLPGGRPRPRFRSDGPAPGSLTKVEGPASLSAGAEGGGGKRAFLNSSESLSTSLFDSDDSPPDESLLEESASYSDSGRSNTCNLFIPEVATYATRLHEVLVVLAVSSHTLAFIYVTRKAVIIRFGRGEVGSVCGFVGWSRGSPLGFRRGRGGRGVRCWPANQKEREKTPGDSNRPGSPYTRVACRRRRSASFLALAIPLEVRACSGEPLEKSRKLRQPPDHDARARDRETGVWNARPAFIVKPVSRYAYPIFINFLKFYDILSEAYNKIMKVGFAKFLASLVYDTSGRPRTKGKLAAWTRSSTRCCTVSRAPTRTWSSALWRRMRMPSGWPSTRCT